MTEQRRIYIGSLLLILGSLLILWAWGSWFYRKSVEHKVISQKSTAGSEVESINSEQAIRVLPRVLVVSLVLLIVVFTTGYAVARFGRHYRTILEHKRNKPTPSTGVWEMHRLPDDWDDQHDHGQTRGT